jgi:hypothetical protein
VDLRIYSHTAWSFVRTSCYSFRKKSRKKALNEWNTATFQDKQIYKSVFKMSFSDKSQFSVYKSYFEYGRY